MTPIGVTLEPPPAPPTLAASAGAHVVDAPMTAPQPAREGGPPHAFVDLHAHSTASDGSEPPEMLVARAVAVGLVAVALTDHDTVAGVAAARAAGDAAGVPVIAGVELSAFDSGGEVHILGLHLASPDRLAAPLSVFQETRVSRAEEIVRALNALGIPVTMDAVLAASAGGAIGRPHVAKALIAGGWVRDHREAFDRYLGADRPAYVGKHRLTAADAMELIHDAGGVAIFAHPGRDGTLARIQALAAVGLDGVEVLHPSHGAEDVARLSAIAEHLELLRSGGSDWHGAPDGMRALGGMHVPAEWSARQDDRAAALYRFAA
jgi:predicted metal-dependent phosphoesterase TrpH